MNSGPIEHDLGTRTDLGERLPEMPLNMNLETALEYLGKAIDRGHNYLVYLSTTALTKEDTDGEPKPPQLIVFDPEQLVSNDLLPDRERYMGKVWQVRIYVNTKNLDPSFRFKEEGKPRSGVTDLSGNEYESRVIDTGLEENPLLNDLVALCADPARFYESARQNPKLQEAVADWLSERGVKIGGQRLTEVPGKVLEARRVQVVDFMNGLSRLQHSHNESKIGDKSELIVRTKQGLETVGVRI